MKKVRGRERASVCLCERERERVCERERASVWEREICMLQGKRWNIFGKGEITF